MSMEINQAIKCFRENLKIFNQISEGPNSVEYNLHKGLLHIANAINNLENEIKSLEYKIGMK